MKKVISSKKSNDQHLSYAKLIKELNETKQYTLMATSLLESILTDSNLAASAAKLWEYLYTKAIMDKNLSVKIRYEDIANKFNRSTRTIKRYVENLKENGYLHVESNFHFHGQRANTFYLTIPTKVSENLKNTKDRKKVIKECTSVTHEALTANSAVQPISSDATNENLNNREVTNLDFHVQEDKTVILDHDTSVTPKNTNQNNILVNNNSTVVVSPIKFSEATNFESFAEHEANPVLRGTSKDTKDIQDQKIIKGLEEKIASHFIKMGNITGSERTDLFDEIQKFRTTITTITVMMNQRKQAIKSNLTNINDDKTALFLEPSMDFMHVAGDRKLSNSEVTRIQKAIEKSVYADNQQRICNEIIYAIRFGTLIKSQNGTILSISHAISIAVKLLREKRWETPAQIKGKEKSGFQFKKVYKQQSISGIATGQQHVSGLLNSLRTA
jgi:hypothetical protein